MTHIRNIKIAGLICLAIGMSTLTGCDMIDELSIKLGEKAIEVSKSAKDKFDETALKTSDQLDENEFVFTEPKIKEKSTLTNPDKVTDSINLYIGDGVYYTVDLPQDTELVTDNSKYIYGEDNSFNIQVISGVNYDKLSEYLTNKKIKHLQPDLLGTQDTGKKEVQEAIKYIANYRAILVRCYDNPLVYATVLNSLENNTYEVTAFPGMVSDKDKTKVLKILPTVTGYHATITVGMKNKNQKIYNYNDGSLIINKEFKKFKDSIKENGIKLAIIAGDNTADSYYKKNDILLIEKNNYTLALIKVNYNTTISLLSTGKEAKFNLLTFIKQYSN